MLGPDLGKEESCRIDVNEKSRVGGWCVPVGWCSGAPQHRFVQSPRQFARCIRCNSSAERCSSAYKRVRIHVAK